MTIIIKQAEATCKIKVPLSPRCFFHRSPVHDHRPNYNCLFYFIFYLNKIQVQTFMAYFYYNKYFDKARNVFLAHKITNKCIITFYFIFLLGGIYPIKSVQQDQIQQRLSYKLIILWNYRKTPTFCLANTNKAKHSK